MAVSWNSSAATPPMPSRMAGPSCGSRWKPRIISALPLTSSCTRKPSGAGAPARRRLSSMVAQAAGISAAATPTRTPPTSLLWAISRDRTFSTTRPPSASAAACAAAASAATISRVTGTPKRANSALLSASFSGPPGSGGSADVGRGRRRRGLGHRPGLQRRQHGGAGSPARRKPGCRAGSAAGRCAARAG